MSAATLSEQSNWEEATTCWDVVAEHLDEAAYAAETLLEIQQHPLLTLSDQSVWGESRLGAHIDGLVVGSETVAEKVLRPEVEQPSPDDPTRLLAVLMALLQGGRERDALRFVVHPNEQLRAAGAHAFRWSERGSDLAQQSLSPSLDPNEQASLLAVLTACAVPVPNLDNYLQSPVPAVAAAAARAALGSDRLPALLSPLESLLEHDDSSVVTAALLPTLACGSPFAQRLLAQLVAQPPLPDAHLWALHAALSGKAAHGVTVERAKDRTAAPAHEAALFALGFTGDLAHADLLLGMLGVDSPRTVALATQALALLFGFDLNDEALFLEPSAAPSTESSDQDDDGLPPFEQDDLDADLKPLPEEALRPPDVEAFAAAIHERRTNLNPNQRHLHGTPFSAGSLVQALIHGPLRVRHVLADVLTVLSSGTQRVDTYGMAAQQRRQLDALVTPAGLRLANVPLT